ncbi:hypothetical protein ACQJBY_022756 [Aegilops geniculata]
MASTTASTRFYGTLGSPLRLGLFGESRNVMCAFCFGGFAKAIMVGKVGQEPVQKRLRSGKTVVLFSLGTGGIRNNRRPLDNEEPHQYAERSSVQWHRVCIYPDRLGSLALKHVKTGWKLDMRPVGCRFEVAYWPSGNMEILRQRCSPIL